jgi:hypothetical protein
VKLISRDSRSAKTEENMTGWWFQPLWKIWVRQLGLLFPIYGKIKKCSKPPTRWCSQEEPDDMLLGKTCRESVLQTQNVWLGRLQTDTDYSSFASTFLKPMAFSRTSRKYDIKEICHQQYWDNIGLYQLYLCHIGLYMVISC